jgi:hypothetical protein
VIKVPAIVYLERVDIRDAMDLSSLPNEVDERILSRDTNIAMFVAFSVDFDEELTVLCYNSDIVILL